MFARWTISAMLLGVFLIAGCDMPGETKQELSPDQIQAIERDRLTHRQRVVHPEITETAQFESLADFERYSRYSSEQQMAQFQVFPKGLTGRRQLNYKRFHTGGTALEVTLEPGSALIFSIPFKPDFSAYPLLSLSLYSETLRDDLQISLQSQSGVWTSTPVLVRPGWNRVQVDIQRLGRVKDFDPKNVQSLRLQFSRSASPVTFWLDDILLIDNRRELKPTPEGVTLSKNGLDFSLDLGGEEGVVRLVQSNDGLWRLGVHQPTVKLAGPEEPLPAAGEKLDRMGAHRIGQVEVLELNPVRIRLRNTWYFPGRSGEWATEAVRYIRWTYTFWADGRWVCYVELNNAGGPSLGKVGISLFGRKAAWISSGITRSMVLDDFAGPVGRWSYLLAPTGKTEAQQLGNYLHPATLQTVLAREDVFSAGDTNRDRFDESEGCYVLAAQNGHCRFRIFPPKGGLVRPAFRILGPFVGDVSVNFQGLAIRNIAVLDDGSAVFILPEKITEPAYVEVTGKVK